MRHAERWWRSARSIAQQSGDIETVTWVRGREAVRAIYEQRPLGLILRLITEAESHAHNAPARALPELISGKAQALALAGRADDATAALQQLADIYAALPSDATADRDTIFAWADDRVRFTESFVYSQLGQVEQAAVAQAQALAAYPASIAGGRPKSSCNGRCAWYRVMTSPASWWACHPLNTSGPFSTSAAGCLTPCRLHSTRTPP